MDVPLVPPDSCLAPPQQQLHRWSVALAILLFAVTATLFSICSWNVDPTGSSTGDKDFQRVGKRMDLPVEEMDGSF